MKTHRYTYDVWKADGESACYFATCSCGWHSEAGLLGYGYPATSEGLHAEHVTAMVEQAPVRSGMPPKETQ